jgi:hypothetical protein
MQDFLAHGNEREMNCKVRNKGVETSLTYGEYGWSHRRERFRSHSGPCRAWISGEPFDGLESATDEVLAKILKTGIGQRGVDIPEKNVNFDGGLSGGEEGTLWIRLARSQDGRPSACWLPKTLWMTNNVWRVESQCLSVVLTCRLKPLKIR